MISSGSIVSLGVGASTRFDQDPDSVMQSVASALQAQGLPIRAYTTQTESAASQALGLLTFAPKNFTVKMQVQTYQDYDSTQDLLNAIVGEIYSETGFWPTQSSVTQVTSPDGVSMSTGQPDVTNPSASSGSPTAGIAGSIEKFFTTLTSTTKWILIAVVGIVVLVLIVAAFSPNTPHIARAVAGAAL